MMNAAIARPGCLTEIKLNGSLASPQIAAIREEYERQIAQTNAAILAREDDVKKQLAGVAACGYRWLPWRYSKIVRGAR